jgi:hypothetical protein
MNVILARIHSGRTAGCTHFDHKINDEILEKLKVEPVEEKQKRLQSKCLHYVTSMNNNRMLQIMLNSRPNGCR